MLDLVPTVYGQHGCLIVSVSSFLIMVLLQLRLAASISMCSASRAGVRLLPRDDSVVLAVDDQGVGGAGRGVVVAPQRQALRPCERCARRGASRSDIVAVMTALCLGGDDDADDGNGKACAGCEAMWAVDDLLDSKVASEAELREAFDVFDRDEDGFVGPGELWNVLRRLGMVGEGATTPEDCWRMIAARDGDGDGMISFRDFRDMMENAV